MDNRAGKQCRESWYHHLRPGIKADPCTDEEEGILVELHKEDDSNWAMPSRFLPGDPKHDEESLERDEKEEVERLLNQQHGLNKLHLRLNSHFNGGKPSRGVKLCRKPTVMDQIIPEIEDNPAELMHLEEAYDIDWVIDNQDILL